MPASVVDSGVARLSGFGGSGEPLQSTGGRSTCANDRRLCFNRRRFVDQEHESDWSASARQGIRDADFDPIVDDAHFITVDADF